MLCLEKKMTMLCHDYFGKSKKVFHGKKVFQFRKRKVYNVVNIKDKNLKLNMQYGKMEALF